MSSPRDCSHAEVLEAKDGRILKRLVLQQHGIRYHDMVNALRDQAPAEVDVWDACATWPREKAQRRRAPLTRRLA